MTCSTISALISNIPPDRRGLIHEKDAARLAELRAVLDETFKTKLAGRQTATADHVRNDDPDHGPPSLLDGDPQTYWTTDEGVRTATLTIELGEPVTFDRALIQEHIALGQRVRTFTLEAWDEQAWQPIAAGTTIGYKRLLRFPEVTATRVRLAILDSRAAPAISELALFKASEREPSQDP